MYSDVVTRFFSISKMSSARTDLALAQVEQRARALPDPTLVGLAEAGRAAAARTARVEAMHRTQSKARGSGEAKRVDKRMDAAVAGFFEGCVDEITYLRSAGDPAADAYQAIIDVHFAGQVSTITRAPYEEELQRVEALHAVLVGEAAELVERAGLSRWVRRIAADLQPYRDALAARKLVTRGDLASARNHMHGHTCGVVGYAVAMHGDSPSTLAELLAPIVDQQDRIAAVMRARRQGVATGAEGDGDDLIDGDGELDAALDGPADNEPDAAPESVDGP